MLVGAYGSPGVTVMFNVARTPPDSSSTWGKARNSEDKLTKPD